MVAGSLRTSRSRADRHPEYQISQKANSDYTTVVAGDIFLRRCGAQDFIMLNAFNEHVIFQNLGELLYWHCLIECLSSMAGSTNVRAASTSNGLVNIHVNFR